MPLTADQILDLPFDVQPDPDEFVRAAARYEIVTDAERPNWNLAEYPPPSRIRLRQSSTAHEPKSSLAAPKCQSASGRRNPSAQSHSNRQTRD